SLLMLTPISPLFPYTTLFRSGIPKGFGDLFVSQSVSGQGFVQKPAALQQHNRLRITTHAPAGALIGRWGYAFASLRPTETSRYRSEEHTSELQSRFDIVCRLL